MKGVCNNVKEQRCGKLLASEERSDNRQVHGAVSIRAFQRLLPKKRVMDAEGNETQVRYIASSN